MSTQLLHDLPWTLAGNLRDVTIQTLRVSDELELNGVINGVLKGTMYYVDSASGSAGNDGLSWAGAKATLAQAKALAVAGDVIYVAPGHAETLAAPVTFSVAGVTVLGLGSGNTRPTFTVNHTGDGFSIEAADVTVENVLFPAPSAATSALVNIAAARASLRKVGFVLGANVVDAVTITGAGEVPLVEYCDVAVTANGPDSWLKCEGVIDRLIVRRNVVLASDGANPFDDGVIDVDSVAITNPAIYDNVFLGGGQAVTVLANVGAVVGGAYGPNVYAGSAVDADNVSGGAANLSTITDQLSGATGIASFPNAAIPANGVSLAEVLRQVYASIEGTAGGQNGVATWPASAAPGNNVSLAEALRDVWDVVRNGTGGAEPESNKSVMDYLGVSPGFYVPSLGYAVSKTEDVNTAVGDDLFDVTGKVLITHWTGEVTNALAAGVNDYKLRIKSANTDLCAAGDLGGAAIGFLFQLGGDAGDTILAMGSQAVSAVKAADSQGKGRAERTLGLAGGACTLQSNRTAGDAADAIVHTLFYLPLEVGASVAAAA